MQTNIIYFEVDTEGSGAVDVAALEAELAERGVLIFGGYATDRPGASRRFRAVLHRDISREAVHAVVDAFDQLLA